jgi:hypothetical protein
MELKSQDGALFELRPVGYQFPSLGSSGGSYHFDANWLIIRGNVTMTDGRCWCFEEPCLTTGEARQIVRWMRNVAEGTVEPSVIDSFEEYLLFFTEPNLAFSLEDHNANQARIRIHFSCEALPPWLIGATQPDVFDFFIVLDVEHKHLLDAATQWKTELMAFPER